MHANISNLICEIENYQPNVKKVFPVNSITSGWVDRLSELANSIENTIAIAFLSTIAIAIDKGIFQLLLLL